jgi:cytochrome P450
MDTTVAALPLAPLPAPVPRKGPANAFQVFAGMRRNPITLWTRRHFEEPSVTRRGIMGLIVALQDPAAIRHVLVDNAANYRKDPLQLRVLRPMFGDGILLAEGEAWRRLRRTTAPGFVPRRVDAFAPAMDLSARAATAGLRDLPAGSAVQVDAAMADVTLAVLAATVFPGGLGTDARDITGAITRYLETAGRVSPLDILGVPDWVPRPGRVRARGAIAVLRGAMQRLIDAERAGKPAADTPPTLLTGLLAARDPETGAALGDDEVLDTLLTFTAAGHETTANALTWTLLLLALHPAIREACEAEADAVAGLPAEAAAERLVLLRAVIEEAMRLYPPAAIITRQAIAADTAAGIAVPAGALTVVSTWVLHRHRLLWDAPEAFRPARFLPENRASIPRFAYLPFGAGPRICIGAGFALQEAVLVLAALLRTVRLDLPAGAQPPMPIQRITLRPEGGLTLLATPRTA